MTMGRKVRDFGKDKKKSLYLNPILLAYSISSLSVNRSCPPQFAELLLALNFPARALKTSSILNGFIGPNTSSGLKLSCSLSADLISGLWAQAGRGAPLGRSSSSESEYSDLMSGSSMASDSRSAWEAMWDWRAWRCWARMDWALLEEEAPGAWEGRMGWPMGLACDMSEVRMGGPIGGMTRMVEVETEELLGACEGRWAEDDEAAALEEGGRCRNEGTTGLGGRPDRPAEAARLGFEILDTSVLGGAALVEDDAANRFGSGPPAALSVVLVEAASFLFLDASSSALSRRSRSSRSFLFRSSSAVFAFRSASSAARTRFSSSAFAFSSWLFLTIAWFRRASASREMAALRSFAACSWRAESGKRASARIQEDQKRERGSEGRTFLAASAARASALTGSAWAFLPSALAANLDPWAYTDCEDVDAPSREVAADWVRELDNVLARVMRDCKEIETEHVSVLSRRDYRAKRRDSPLTCLRPHPARRRPGPLRPPGASRLVCRWPSRSS